MFIKILVEVGLDVPSGDEADEACHDMERGLPTQLADFPIGEVIGVKVRQWEDMPREEADERGWLE